MIFVQLVAWWCCVTVKTVCVVVVNSDEVLFHEPDKYVHVILFIIRILVRSPVLRICCVIDTFRPLKSQEFL